jgi:peroxiredoxin
MVIVSVNPAFIAAMTTNTGHAVSDISNQHPVMLVFLRHFGCVFCREALAELSAMRSVIESNGTELIFVHMAENKVADDYFIQYKLPNVKHVSDPECLFYKSFGLTKGTINQLFGLQTWRRGFQNVMSRGSEMGKHLGDSFQMPGIFMIKKSQIVDAFIHKNVAERPDYCELARRNV